MEIKSHWQHWAQKIQDDNTPPQKNTTIKKQHKAKQIRNIESTKQPEVTHVLPKGK